ncbi:hypothetical protein ACTFIZ_009739 [Dictyostelium cf. discoideum]
MIWDDEEMLKFVKESWNIFSQKGYYHKDLCKRHATKYTEFDKINIVFIDLSRVEMNRGDKSEKMYSCIINDPKKQPTVVSIKKNLKSSTIQKITDTVATTKTNTSQEQSTPFKSPKGHQ